MLGALSRIVVASVVARVSRCSPGGAVDSVLGRSVGAQIARVGLGLAARRGRVSPGVPRAPGARARLAARAPRGARADRSADVVSFDVARGSLRPVHGPVLDLARPRNSPISPGSRNGQRVIDVGCGPGALTAELVEPRRRRSRGGGRPLRAVRRRRTGAASRRRRPAGAGRAAAVRGRRFDAALAQLVVHFMARAGRGAPRDGARHAARTESWRLRLGSRGWQSAAQRVLGGGAGDRPGGEGEPGSRGARRASSRSSSPLRVSGRRGARAPVSVEHATFEEWSEPSHLRRRPAGAHAAGLDPAMR